MKQIDLITIVLLVIVAVIGVAYYLISTILAPKHKKDLPTPEPTPTTTTPPGPTSPPTPAQLCAISEKPLPRQTSPEYCTLNLDVSNTTEVYDGGKFVKRINSIGPPHIEQQWCADRYTSTTGPTKLSTYFATTNAPQGKVPKLFTNPTGTEKWIWRKMKTNAGGKDEIDPEGEIQTQCEHLSPDSMGEGHALEVCPGAAPMGTLPVTKKQTIEMGKYSVLDSQFYNSTCKLHPISCGPNTEHLSECLHYAPFCVDEDTAVMQSNAGQKVAQFINRRAILWKRDDGQPWLWICVNSSTMLERAYPYTHYYTGHTTPDGIFAPLVPPDTLGMTIKTGFNPAMEVKQIN